jgi:predicted DCC family thiol-disulfide oxidoreductase YuxK
LNGIADQKFEVFYDGDCPLCRREIQMIRRKDTQQSLVLTDISSSTFESKDRSLNELMREIHGRYGDGRYVTGVEVFREIYSRIGFARLVKPSRWPVIRTILNGSYSLFAKIRYHFAMRRMKKQDCEACSPLGSDVQDLQK